MSSTDSSISSVSDDELYQSDDFSAVEVEENGGSQAAASDRPNSNGDEFDDDEGPHQFDPLADESFTAEYEREREEREEEERRLTRRFEGIDPLICW